MSPWANWSGRKCCSRSTGARGKSIGKWMVGFDGSKSMQMAPFCTQAFDLGSWNYYPCGDLEILGGSTPQMYLSKCRAHDSCSANCSCSSWEVLSVNPIKCIGFSRWPDLPFFLVKRAHQKDKGVYGRAGRPCKKNRGAGGSIFYGFWWESERNTWYTC